MLKLQVRVLSLELDNAGAVMLWCIKFPNDVVYRPLRPFLSSEYIYIENKTVLPFHDESDGLRLTIELLRKISHDEPTIVSKLCVLKTTGDWTLNSQYTFGKIIEQFTYEEFVLQHFVEML
jgi:hypothetical protein